MIKSLCVEVSRYHALPVESGRGSQPSKGTHGNQVSAPISEGQTAISSSRGSTCEAAVYSCPPGVSLIQEMAGTEVKSRSTVVFHPG